MTDYQFLAYTRLLLERSLFAVLNETDDEDLQKRLTAAIDGISVDITGLGLDARVTEAEILQ